MAVAYQASLEAKCNDTVKDSSGQRWQTIESRVMVRNERACSGKSTSSGGISEYARRDRLENTEEIRRVYQNFAARNHFECFLVHPMLLRYYWPNETKLVPQLPILVERTETTRKQFSFALAGASALLSIPKAEKLEN